MVDYVFERHLSGGIHAAREQGRLHRTTDPARLHAEPARARAAAASRRAGRADRAGWCSACCAARSIARPRPRAPSAAVHASTSGWVRAIEERLVLAGNGVQPSTCIVIETDGRDEREPRASNRWPADRAAQLERMRAERHRGPRRRRLSDGRQARDARAVQDADRQRRGMRALHQLRRSC